MSIKAEDKWIKICDTGMFNEPVGFIRHANDAITAILCAQLMSSMVRLNIIKFIYSKYFRKYTRYFILDINGFDWDVIYDYNLIGRPVAKDYVSGVLLMFAVVDEALASF